MARSSASAARSRMSTSSLIILAAYAGACPWDTECATGAEARGELGATQLLMPPDDANTLGQVRQDAGDLPWKGPVQTPRHEPKPPSGLPADRRVLCNEFWMLSKGRTAPICASV